MKVDRRALGLGGAAAVTVGTVVAILVFGYVPLPEFPQLSESPVGIPGTIAFSTFDRDRSCVMTVPASGGTPVEVYCRSYGPEELAWTSDGDIVVVSYDLPTGPTLMVIDPASGATLGVVDDDDMEIVRDWSEGRTLREDGARVVVDRSTESTATLSVRWSDGRFEPVISAEGPRDYSFSVAIWSPDGRWILAGDSRGRLVIVAADGSAGPFLLAELDHEIWTAAQIAWFVPGDSTNTVNVELQDTG